MLAPWLLQVAAGEAVHAFSGWADLKGRLDARNRRWGWGGLLVRRERGLTLLPSLPPRHCPSFSPHSSLQGVCVHARGHAWRAAGGAAHRPDQLRRTQHAAAAAAHGAARTLSQACGAAPRGRAAPLRSHLGAAARVALEWRPCRRQRPRGGRRGGGGGGPAQRGGFLQHFSHAEGTGWRGHWAVSDQAGGCCLLLDPAWRLEVLAMVRAACTLFHNVRHSCKPCDVTRR